jgi:hypothetical protein
MAVRDRKLLGDTARFRMDCVCGGYIRAEYLHPKPHRKGISRTPFPQRIQFGSQPSAFKVLIPVERGVVAPLAKKAFHVSGEERREFRAGLSTIPASPSALRMGPAQPFGSGPNRWAIAARLRPGSER